MTNNLIMFVPKTSETPAPVRTPAKENRVDHGFKKALLGALTQKEEKPSVEPQKLMAGLGQLIPIKVAAEHHEETHEGEGEVAIVGEPLLEISDLEDLDLALQELVDMIAQLQQLLAKPSDEASDEPVAIQVDVQQLVKGITELVHKLSGQEDDSLKLFNLLTIQNPQDQNPQDQNPREQQLVEALVNLLQKVKTDGVQEGETESGQLQFASIISALKKLANPDSLTTEQKTDLLVQLTGQLQELKEKVSEIKEKVDHQVLLIKGSQPLVEKNVAKEIEQIDATNGTTNVKTNQTTNETSNETTNQTSNETSNETTNQTSNETKENPESKMADKPEQQQQVNQVDGDKAKKHRTNEDKPNQQKSVEQPMVEATITVGKGETTNFANRVMDIPVGKETNQVREQVFQQLVQKAHLLVAGEHSEMTIQLKPDHLGKLNMQVTVENGLVTAKFAAESMQVKEVIESNLANLKQTLTNQGLKVDQITVTVGQGGEQMLPWSRRQNSNSGKGRSGSNHSNEELLEDVVVAEYGYGLGVSDSMVDYKA